MKRLTVRLSDDDHRVIESVAAALDLTESEVMRLGIRSLTDRDLITPDPPGVVDLRESVDRCTAQIRRVGGNVNQVVRAIHVDGLGDDDTMARVLELPGVLDGLADFVRDEVSHHVDHEGAEI